MQGAWFQSLMWELRSRMLHDAAKQTSNVAIVDQISVAWIIYLGQLNVSVSVLIPDYWGSEVQCE